jgi:hypothetical protein
MQSAKTLADWGRVMKKICCSAEHPSRYNGKLCPKTVPVAILDLNEDSESQAKGCLGQIFNFKLGRFIAWHDK